MRKLTSPFLAVTVFAVMLSSPAFADDWRWHQDIHHFHEHDYEHWRGGRWVNGFHEGRNGWWWVVGGFWYFYPAPIYPYPDPYTPPNVVIEQVQVVPGAVVAPSSVYYCSNPAGYYPYVAQCYGAWQKVVVASAPAPVVQPQVIMQPPMAPVGSQRELDDRQLNAYAVEFQNINPADRHARRMLKDLAKRVGVFHQALFQHGYNAMDILRDTEGLEHRINDQINKLPKRTVVTPTIVVQPAPVPPPVQ